MIFKLFLKNRKYTYIEPDIGVRQLSRDTFEVKYHDRVAIIEAEYIGGEYTRDIYDELLLHWQSADCKELITEHDRFELLRVLKLFFDKIGETYFP